MLELLSEHKSFDGKVSYWKHPSKTCKTYMKFSIFQPPMMQSKKEYPTLYFLAGLTCTEETFMMKAGALGLASKLGIILVCPDTSPRNTLITGENDDWDFGSGAGFYINATQKPWKQNYQMFSYVTEELPEILIKEFDCDKRNQSIFGHSMGGHGALICALKRPDLYKSVSAFAPILSPSQSPWGIKAFSGYLGNDKKLWKEWDTSCLIEKMPNHYVDILIDQGTKDEFLEKELMTNKFIEKCKLAQQKITLNFHKGYDHGYNFISTFMENHLNFHAKFLIK